MIVMMRKRYFLWGRVRGRIKRAKN